jgi:uncharacterized repeat protein (TIGR01451 family)
MNVVKTTISIILMFFLVFLTAGSAFADANIGVTFDKDTAKVGEQVNLIVTITNTGPDDLNNIFVSVPFPSGLKYVMHTTGTTRNLYDTSTGVWDVNNLRLTSQGGGVKKLTITAEVLPELAGKTLTATASYISVSAGDPPVPLPLKSATSGVLIISSDSNGGSNSSNNETGSKESTTSSTTKSTSHTVQNGTSNPNSSIDNFGDFNALQGLNQAPKGQAYEVFNSTDQTTPSNATYAIVVLGGLVILVIVGYFMGMRNK